MVWIAKSHPARRRKYTSADQVGKTILVKRWRRRAQTCEAESRGSGAVRAMTALSFFRGSSLSSAVLREAGFVLD